MERFRTGTVGTVPTCSNRTMKVGTGTVPVLVPVPEQNGTVVLLGI